MRVAGATRAPRASLGPAPRRARALAVVVAGLAIAGLLGCPAFETTPTPEGWVRIGTKRIAVDVADTPAEQQKGLGQRDSLPWDHGMYFPYERAGLYAFWMKGMRFSIDIVWIRDGRIVDVHAEVPFVPGENGPTLRPREAADAVLEVPAGYARLAGWRIGDRVHFERTKVRAG